MKHLDFFKVFFVKIKTMKIFIKTELYKNSKYLPHLLEHCIWDAKNPENYFKTISKNFLTCFNDYILIETVEKI